jgi:hypothetical protein
MTATNTLSVSVGDTVHVPMAGCDGRVVRFEGSMVVVQLASKVPGAHDHFHFGALEVVQQQPRAESGVLLDAPGYQSLARVLARAFQQAAHGKGAERHAQDGEPFDAQVMQDMARRFGVGSLLGQAFKKSEESQRLPHGAGVRELLGAINYLAGAVIAMERAETQANG